MTSTRNPWRTWFVANALFAGLLGAGCSGPPSDAAEPGLQGEIRVALANRASDMVGLVLTATGPNRSVTKCFDLSSGGSSDTFAVSGLPLGKVTFTATAYAVPCAQVDANSVATWLSDPVDASVVLGTVAQVSLTMKRNGRADVTLGGLDEPACSALGQGCLSSTECCSGLCTAGVCATACVPADLAVNPAGSGFPSLAGSDPGWGGGSQPYEVLDGHTSYFDTWGHGWAFTGGRNAWMGEPCGTRQATVDFGDGNVKTFNRVLAWHHGGEHVPSSYHIEYWNGTGWVNAGGTSVRRTDLADYPAGGWGSEPTESVFSAVTSSRVRFVIDSNCDIEHGWLYELQVFSACP